jgi:hypothetical protein
MDDSRRMRPISRSVLLDTVPCSGPDGGHGCGRDCPLMFRDEWLEEAPPPPEVTAAPDEGGRYASVRSAEEIGASLDGASTRNGLMFMPEMLGHAGRRFRIRRKVERVFDGCPMCPLRNPCTSWKGCTVPVRSRVKTGPATGAVACSGTRTGCDWSDWRHERLTAKRDGMLPPRRAR